MRLRAVLVVSKKAGEGAGDQWRKLLDYTLARGYDVAGVAMTIAGATEMIDRGEADLVVIESRSQLPIRLESVTADVRLPGRPGRGRPSRLQ